MQFDNFCEYKNHRCPIIWTSACCNFMQLIKIFVTSNCDTDSCPIFTAHKNYKSKKNIRSRQDSNLCGETPLDFESNALTTRPRLLLGWGSSLQLSADTLLSRYCGQSWSSNSVSALCLYAFSVKACAQKLTYILVDNINHRVLWFEKDHNGCFYLHSTKFR